MGLYLVTLLTHINHVVHLLDEQFVLNHLKLYSKFIKNKWIVINKTHKLKKEKLMN